MASHLDEDCERERSEKGWLTAHAQSGIRCKVVYELKVISWQSISVDVTITYQSLLENQKHCIRHAHHPGLDDALSVRSMQYVVALNVHKVLNTWHSESASESSRRITLRIHLRATTSRRMTPSY